MLQSLVLSSARYLGHWGPKGKNKEVPSNSQGTKGLGLTVYTTVVVRLLLYRVLEEAIYLRKPEWLGRLLPFLLEEKRVRDRLCGVASRFDIRTPVYLL